MKRLMKKAEKFNLYSYWNSRQDELKKFVFDDVRQNLDYHYSTDYDAKLRKIKNNLEDMDEMDLEMAMESYLINHNEDLYVSIIEIPTRSEEESMNIDYENEYQIVTNLLKELFNDSSNCKELAETLGLQVGQ